MCRSREKLFLCLLLLMFVASDVYHLYEFVVLGYTFLMFVVLTFFVSTFVVPTFAGVRRLVCHVYFPF